MFGEPQNRYKFNEGTELANQEFSDGSGLELYETPFRGYDPQIGRFWQIDAMADDYASWSPYTFALDNPVFFNDPSGLESEPPKETSTPDNPTELAPVVVKSSYKNKWNYTTWSLFVDANKKHNTSDLYNYLKNQGVDERGLRLFSLASNPEAVAYRERLDEIEKAWRQFVQDALVEGVKWYAGGVVLKVGGKLVNLGYRAYKLRNGTTVYRVVSKGEKVDVLAMNGFRQAPVSSGISSYEGKLFWTNVKDAKWYQNWVGEGNQIMKIKVDKSFIFENGDDVGKQFFYVSPERLEKFNSSIQLIK